MREQKREFNLNFSKLVQGGSPLTESSGASAVILANNHSELNRLWAQKEAKRSDGGWWSLSGFSIQATIGFERFVRRLLIDREPGLNIGFEAVSDLMEADAKVRLTQVKRTLTKESLASAILEACKILALCTPTFAKTIEFQVICERDDAGVTPKDIPIESIFKDEKPDALSHERVIEQFNQADPIKVMSSPGLSLRRTLLTVGVKDPDRVARDALGTLFSAFDGKNRDAVERALYEAISQINSHVVPASSPGRLLTPEKFVHRPSEKASLFTSSRPRLTDLVGNRFLERPDLLSTVATGARTWLAGLEKSYELNELQLPVLWLEGRSGDGKSVLTLQLLEALVARQARLPSVSELDSVDELSSWLNSASPWEGGSQCQAEIAFIDDLASRAEPADIDSLIDRAYYRGSKYIGLITCGTAEGRKAFAKGRHVVVTPIAVPAPTAADYAALRSWAQQRLGRSLSQRDPADASISHFMLRLTLDGQTPIKPEYRVPAELRGALAVNSLGLPAPSWLATDELVSEFVEAWSDLELSLIEDEGGVRIAHAEAAWQLYIEAVNGAELPEAWGADLGRVLAAYLTHGHTTAARTLLGSLMNPRTLMRRLSRADYECESSAVMDQTFRSVAETCPKELRACLFRLWLPACARGKLTAIETTALREEGRSLLANREIDPETRAEVATTLLLVARAKDHAHRAAAAYLKHASPGYAVGKFIVTVLTAQPGRYDTDLTDVAISWLASNQDAVEIGQVLAQVIGKAPPRKLQALALEYVKKHRANPASGPVLCALSNSKPSKAFQVTRDAWLKTCADPSSAVVIYRQLFQSRPKNWQRYVSGALKLIRAHPNERAMQDILSILMSRRRHDPAVIGATRTWVDLRAYDTSATPVLIQLVSTPDLEVEDLERALRHIETDSPGRQAMFGTLSVVLKFLPEQASSKLRAQLSRELADIFDQAFNSRAKSARGKDIEMRLHKKKANQQSLSVDNTSFRPSKRMRRPTGTKSRASRKG